LSAIPVASSRPRQTVLPARREEIVSLKEHRAGRPVAQLAGLDPELERPEVRLVVE
jgi:hypothetical protein